MFGITFCELIDTLWNVNRIHHHRLASRDERINRYIMECKFASKREVVVSTSELIDTLWNVNPFTIPCKYSAVVVELIDTLWNVNTSFTKSFNFKTLN